MLAGTRFVLVKEASWLVSNVWSFGLSKENNFWQPEKKIQRPFTKNKVNNNIEYSIFVCFHVFLVNLNVDIYICVRYCWFWFSLNCSKYCAGDWLFNILCLVIWVVTKIEIQFLNWIPGLVLFRSLWYRIVCLREIFFLCIQYGLLVWNHSKTSDRSSCGSFSFCFCWIFRWTPIF